MNPNLFKMQEDPDGLEGHLEREEIRKQYEPVTEKQEEKVLPSELPARLQYKLTIGKPKHTFRKVHRYFENSRIQDECEFYDSRCENRDCIYCRQHGVPKDNIKNIIEWM